MLIITKKEAQKLAQKLQISKKSKFLYSRAYDKVLLEKKDI